jgi:hypothetical protein
LDVVICQSSDGVCIWVLGLDTTPHHKFSIFCSPTKAFVSFYHDVVAFKLKIESRSLVRHLLSGVLESLQKLRVFQPSARKVAVNRLATQKICVKRFNTESSEPIIFELTNTNLKCCIGNLRQNEFKPIEAI